MQGSGICFLNSLCACVVGEDASATCRHIKQSKGWTVGHWGLLPPHPNARIYLKLNCAQVILSKAASEWKVKLPISTLLRLPCNPLSHHVPNKKLIKTTHQNHSIYPSPQLPYIPFSPDTITVSNKVRDAALIADSSLLPKYPGTGQNRSQCRTGVQENCAVPHFLDCCSYALLCQTN